MVSKRCLIPACKRNQLPHRFAVFNRVLPIKFLVADTILARIDKIF